MAATLGTIESLIDTIDTHAERDFDQTFLAHVRDIADAHRPLASDCPSGHMYQDDLESCAEFDSAYRLAVAWIQGALADKTKRKGR